ncbi:hypothetical protein [uncultured Imperialibacter sp.]|uniref:hypothetical protein n=1 Tax=uncultured Imperialibacter sp. TaxID=1672639 RepID=UPI0030DD4B17|tara:strand:+ start:10630 stop:10959 length:330 start_codon:yes stop_codon:yes gene_type:complete
MNKIPSFVYLIFPGFHLALIISSFFGVRFDSYWGVDALFSGLIMALIASILYITHVTKNQELNREGKFQWILLIVVGGLLGEIYYWFKHIRKGEFAKSRNSRRYFNSNI